MDLYTIQRTAWLVAEAKGQHIHLDQMDERTQTLIRLGLAHTEVSEALDELTDVILPIIQLLTLHRSLSMATQHAKRGGITQTSKIKIAEELADVIIRCAELAETLGVDLDGAVVAKMDANSQRPHGYGTPWEVKHVDSH